MNTEQRILSKAEHKIARHLKDKYKLRWPFAAHIAKDAVCILEITRLKESEQSP